MESVTTSTSRLVAARVLAIAGTALVGLPFVIPLVQAAIVLIVSGDLHLDYLMPGELFILVAAGGVLLVGATLLARRRRVLAAIGAALPVAFFALLALLTTVTGIDSGVVIGAYVAYVAAAIALVVVDVIVCRELFSH